MRVKSYSVGILLTALYASAAMAELPSVSNSQLAALIALSETNFSRFRADYSVSYGTVAKEDPTKGNFTPLSPAHEVQASYAVDEDSGRRWLRLAQSTTEGPYLKKMLYGRERTISGQTVAPGSAEWVAEVSRSIPPELTGHEGGYHLRPDELLPTGMFGCRLSEAIAQATEIDICEDAIDAGPCYRVTFRLLTEELLEQDGERVAANRIDMYRLWLSPSHGYLPLRVENLRPVANFADADKAIPRESCTVAELKEVAEGVWFPMCIRKVRHRARGDVHKASVLKVNAVTVGPDAEVPSKVSFPIGTRVTDNILRAKYRMGAASSELASQVEQAIRSLKVGDPSTTAGQTSDGDLVGSAPMHAEIQDTSAAPSALPPENRGQLVWWLACIAIAVAAIVAAHLIYKARQRKTPH